jgi:hypothetical protein
MKEEAMKFTCLGYGDEKKWDSMSKNEPGTMIAECFAYEDDLRKSGNWVDGGQALQSARTAKTLRWKDGKVVVTDGPFAETKEQLGGIAMLEARDMNQAVELMSKNPCLRQGGLLEIRPVNDEALKLQMASETECRIAKTVVQRAKAGTIKFACLGFRQEKSGETIPVNERDAMIEQCIAFDEARRKDGHWLGGIALQGVRTAKTLRSKSGKVVVTDGPFAETKEQLGGVVVLGMKDMNHALELMVKHPGLRFGVTIEIRPIDEVMTSRWESRQN